MIGMVKSVSGGGALFNYVCKPSKGFEVDRNLVSGITPKEIFEDFKIYIEQNQRASKKIFSMVLSPSIEDGHKFTQDDFRDITLEFLKELDFDIKNQPYIAFLHNEKNHFHVHIIASRVNGDGSLIKDSHIGKKAQWAAHRVAINRNLISAKQVRIDKFIAIEKEKNQINSIQKNILNAHRSIVINQLNYEDYKRKMFENGFLIQPYLNKQNQLQGHKIIDVHSGIDYKASDIHRSLSLNNLFKIGILPKSNEILHKTLEKPYQEGLKLLQSESTNTYKQKMR
ncbi:relaxase/mobilization nuclease domain-containing protein [Empedobacter sp.]|uniref:relaxase/mobilization nuclease domain-containing protein n=1 Tax=Empedobacter sp. TaxID=1927715 RepID=UPI0028AD0A3C|nr:relaxase/mobilization nuclease domain-containing protein [Empedobacter sp.]